MNDLGFHPDDFADLLEEIELEFDIPRPSRSLAPLDIRLGALCEAVDSRVWPASWLG